MLNSSARRDRRSPLAGLSCAVPLLGCLVLSGGATAEPASGQGQACQQLVEALATDGRVALQGVTFDFNRATLRPESLPALIAARDAILVLGGSWGIEGHTDNVGSRAYNQGLSDARAEAVRDWLESAGVPPAQLSAQGFSFDRPVADNGTDAGRALNRRVELVGAVTPDMLGFGGPAGADPCPDTLTPGTMAADTAPPPIPDWSGAGGQEWLPFSVLMATGYGGATGWGGDRIDMPPGARPEACQALCAANSECAAFSFEPAGSHFVENARCALIGDGTELDLRRDNSHYDGGMFHVSGLKPDARLLTPESEAAAAEIIADLAEIARLRDTVRITAPDTHAPEAWMDVAVDGAVPGGDYPTYLEIALPGDYAFDWMQSKASLFVNDMPDGRSGQIWVPEPGEYVLRYVIDHPTAGKHTITGQPFIVLADAPVATPATPAATPAANPATAPETAGAASLTFPMMVAPGESIPVTYSGPLHGGDWIDIITQGEDDDMSGGWSWAYAEGPPVTLTAPAEEGDYTLRYVAEDPARGRVVVAQETLVVRSPPPVTIADAAIFQRCDGATGTFCELVLPAQDVVLTLAAGYGMTEPLVYETAGGASAARPSFDVVRLSDGAAVILVNARQAQTVYCQNGLSGDEICFTPAFNDGDAMLAGVLFASLASTAMQAEAEAMDGEEGAPVPAGDLQGVWFFRIDMPGTPEDQAHFVVAELMQDAGDVGLQGSFLTAPDAGPLPGLSGDLAGVIAGETLNLTMEGADGVTGLVFTGTAYGSDAYRGMVYLAHAPLTPPTGAIITRIAGPGEDWEGPPWTRGEADGMDAAMQMGAQALQGILGELSGEDRAMAELLGGMLGAMSGAPGAASANAPQAPSAEMTALGGIAVEGLGVEDALILLAPHLEERP
jgi:hypothetical protein